MNVVKASMEPIEEEAAENQEQADISQEVQEEGDFCRPPPLT